MGAVDKGKAGAFMKPEGSTPGFTEQQLGSVALFLLPSLKLKQLNESGRSNESRLHDFLMDNFGGYTAQAGNIFGYWRLRDGADEYGEHREFSVASLDPTKALLLKEFLATLARDLDEVCIYLCIDRTASLIYPGGEEEGD